MIEALTPALAALIASRSPASELLEESIVIGVPVEAPPLRSSKVAVEAPPARTVESAEAKLVEACEKLDASRVTSTAIEPVAAELDAEADRIPAELELASRPVPTVPSVSAVAACFSEINFALSCLSASELLCRVVCRAESCLIGALRA